MFNSKIIFFILISIAVVAQDNQLIQIQNNSFEQSNGIEVPGWKIINNQTTSIENQNFQTGINSFKIVHDEWNQSDIISDVVQLKIGHLYKLSAWIKSENSVTNSIDRYPTSVAACITMESFPFTNHSPAVGATKDWTKIEVEFIATKKSDKVRLHFGFNGNAKGKVWFDNVTLEKVEDISNYIPPETITWMDEGFRYDDRGWIFVHIEGKPYQRGYQYGYLVAEEMVEYMNKLAIEVNEEEPENGWNNFRFVADGFMLRKYEKEFLTEMRGIADGANKAGIKLFDHELDLIDVVAMNSAIDIEWAQYGLTKTANPLSGQSFLNAEDELDIPDRLHKCSSFLANKSSTVDGRIVFGQIFMWGGYTGPHWNVVCDVVPTTGHRLVYQTFPGGIHSGADFYINESGIMIGETTVSQTPFNPDGSPQSNRIRKAAQYASSIDDAVEILTTNNNGMYANDWLIADTKTDEIAVLLLGTYKHKLWRSSNNEFYGDTKDFYWCNNNNKDREVRKEYIPNKDNAPFDLIFTPWNRDIAFNKFYQEQKGNMNAIAGVNVWNSAPINRPHACDGKVTTSEMAENLVFFANSGKVTLREKFIGENQRIPDLPGAVPRLSLGYATMSPIFFTEKIKAWKDEYFNTDEKIEKSTSEDLKNKYAFDSRKLWFNTVYPESEAENWFVSGTAAYWKILNGIPEESSDLLDYYKNEFANLNCRYLYTTNREGELAIKDAKINYTGYKNYQFPRIKGTYLLHQLRLNLGNELFSNVMNKIHDKYREKEISTDDFIDIATDVSGKPLEEFINQWLIRSDLPDPQIESSVTEADSTWKIKLKIDQKNNPYHFFTTVQIECEEEIIHKLIEVKDSQTAFEFEMDNQPKKIIFNALHDVPLQYDNYFTWSNFFDDFHSAMIVYGTKRQIEANHTLAKRFSTMLGDRYSEFMPPVRKDSEITSDELKNHDIIILGNIEDNRLLQTVSDNLNIPVNKNSFTWFAKQYNRSDEGLYATYPNPYNNNKAMYIFSANSALELYQMTKDRNRLPGWAIFKGEKIVEKGYDLDEKFSVSF
jgi:phospholipase B-like protein